MFTFGHFEAIRKDYNSLCLFSFVVGLTFHATNNLTSFDFFFSSKQSDRDEIDVSLYVSSISSHWKLYVSP